MLDWSKSQYEALTLLDMGLGCDLGYLERALSSAIWDRITTLAVGFGIWEKMGITNNAGNELAD